ncbi:hypothetical protein NEPAR06_2248 [Nematocida parisii]|uniref:uncharacterized protein n=1 Tax=Nematocida parisii (strain ERTm1 / ATCC PRA-289) TaxID=881290 RepID=UPI000264B39D|nr:uncharacterized protein NEPG_02442 [Nematocida parisii ERTm1]EIJ92751.1 hypothetical protein NEPG_02442 [Nematocida parisii ERTm1]KAI5146193.1 hypothetical protein NEPAR07_2184 [Nematocida parisii]KAI5156702.1 hypothetical protein NEPAR06_2248 [Nematocida parisii]KAI5158950.1 hypothetical protein NEPAR05_2297 [Nematocida parisii]|eukprot:XP_013060269.1 hypothetical protein NEPG_02442 [Nematocida parisii ERTm1]
MKQKILILGIIIVTQIYCHGSNPVYSTAENPIIPVEITESKKKKNVLIDNLNYITGLLYKASIFLKNTVISGLLKNSKIKSTVVSEDFPEYSDFDDHFIDSSTKQINNSKSEITKCGNSTYSNPKKSKLYVINQIRPSFIPEHGDIAEVIFNKSDIPEKKSEIENGFLKFFQSHTGQIPDTKGFIKNGIKNAKKNLLLQAKLARAYTSAAANKTMDVFDNTVRSSHLLADLVRKGLVTPNSAAKELTNSVRDLSSDFLDRSTRSMKGAANYLLHAAVGSVDGIVNGLKYSPSAVNGLMSSYKSILNNPKFNLSEHIPSLAVSLEMDMRKLTEFIHPPDMNKLGSLWESVEKSVDSLKGQWTDINSSLFNHQTEHFKDRFMSLTEDIAKTLDTLSVRLGKSLELVVPGIDALRYRFKCILDEIKKKNDLTISGNLNLKELLDYSMGLFSQLKDIDLALLGLSSDGFCGSIKKNISDSRENPLNVLPGYNSVGKRVFNKLSDLRGIR